MSLSTIRRIVRRPATPIQKKRRPGTRQEIVQTRVKRLFCRRSPPFPVTASLHADCALLLASRDLLAGEASLNWSEDIPIEFWRGVTVAGAPPRV